MDSDPVFDAYVSYSWDEPAKSWVRGHLVPSLQAAGLNICLDVDEFDITQDLVLEMDRTLRQSRRAICVITPGYFDTNSNTLFEALFVHRRDLTGHRGDLILLILVDPGELPAWISGRIRVEWNEDDELPSKWSRLLRSLGAKNLTVSPPGPPPRSEPLVSTREGAPAASGVLPRTVVFGSEFLPGQEYAIELLTAPLLLRRNSRGGVTLTVNRDGVTEALISTEGKREICERVYDNDPDKITAARRLDAEIHRYLLGRSAVESLALRLDDHPLRWASGGVFSVVRWRDRLWTPFFFRDIKPYGWNIALGSSERGDDLSDPWTYLMREFLEETLVLNTAPRDGRVLDFKRFLFDRVKFPEETRRAEAFAAVHLLERHRRDRLKIRATAEPGRLGEPDSSLYVDVDLLPTRNVVEIVRAGELRECRNVLLCINLLELGIEVVKVAEYALDDGDEMLDGELSFSGAHPELVRMPMALISHEYLSGAFQDEELRYEGTTESSVTAPPIPPGAIHIFDFDARRRRQIALGGKHESTDWERKRYGPWLEKFGKNFFDEAGQVSTNNACTLFTPASAKVASYYFAQSST